VSGEEKRRERRVGLQPSAKWAESGVGSPGSSSWRPENNGC